MDFELDQCVYFLGNDGSGGAMIVRPYPPHPWMKVRKAKSRASAEERDTMLVGLLISASMLFVALLLSR